MGLFSILTNKIKPKEYIIDFVNWRGTSLGKCTVSFLNCNPGCFWLNGESTSIGSGYVEDIGPSSDMKYSRISTSEYTFWVSHSDAKSFYSELMKCKSSVESRASLSRSTTFDDYLGSSRDYFELHQKFNISGTSHNYGYGKGVLISRLRVGDRLTLNAIEDQIIVVDNHGRQLGFVPISTPLRFDEKEMLSQIDAGITLEVRVSNSGIVGSTDTWWCEVEQTLKIPYLKSEQCVYMAKGGHLYHQSETCNSNIVMKVPLSYAQYIGRSPCRKCCETYQ